MISGDNSSTAEWYSFYLIWLKCPNCFNNVYKITSKIH